MPPHTEKGKKIKKIARKLKKKKILFVKLKSLNFTLAKGKEKETARSRERPV